MVKAVNAVGEKDCTLALNFGGGQVNGRGDVDRKLSHKMCSIYMHVWMYSEKK